MSCKTCKRALLPEHEDKDGNCCFCAPENFELETQWPSLTPVGHPKPKKATSRKQASKEVRDKP